MELEANDLPLENCFDLIDRTISNILTTVIETSYLNQIKQKVVPYAVSNTCLLIFNSIDFLFIRREIAEPCELQEHNEPQPCTSEAWARSVIPVKIKYVEPVEPCSLSLALSASNSFMKRTGNIFKNSFKKKDSKQFSKIYDEQVKGTPILADEKPYDAHEEFLRIKKIRDEKRKEDEKVRLKALRQEEKRKKHLIMMQFRGKVPEYTHSSEGKLIFVTPIKTFSTNSLETVNYKVSEPPADQRVTRSDSIQDLPARPVEAVFHRPLFDKVSANIIENLQLSPGVSLKRHEVPVSVQIGIAEQGKSDLMTAKSEPSLKVPLAALKTLKSPAKPANPAESVEKCKTERVLSDKTSWKSKYSIKNIIKSSKELDQMQSLSPVDKFNLGIVSNATWGVNPSLRQLKLPARVPKDNNLKDDWEVFGHIYRKPKDNLFATKMELIAKNDQLKKPKDRKVTRFAAKTNNYKISHFYSP